MGKSSVGFLILAAFIGVLAGNILGGLLGVVFDSLGLQDNVVQKVLVDPLVEYNSGEIPLNLIVIKFKFGFFLNFNVLSLLGIGTAWYYAKYSY